MKAALSQLVNKFQLFFCNSRKSWVITEITEFGEGEGQTKATKQRSLTADLLGALTSVCHHLA